MTTASRVPLCFLKPHAILLVHKCVSSFFSWKGSSLDFNYTMKFPRVRQKSSTLQSAIALSPHALIHFSQHKAVSKPTNRNDINQVHSQFQS